MGQTESCDVSDDATPHTSPRAPRARSSVTRGGRVLAAWQVAASVIHSASEQGERLYSSSSHSLETLRLHLVCDRASCIVGNAIILRLLVHHSKRGTRTSLGETARRPDTFTGRVFSEAPSPRGAPGRTSYSRSRAIRRRVKKPRGCLFAQTAQMPAASSKGSDGPITRGPVSQRRHGSSGGWHHSCAPRRRGPGGRVPTSARTPRHTENSTGRCISRAAPRVAEAATQLPLQGPHAPAGRPTGLRWGPDGTSPSTRQLFSNRPVVRACSQGCPRRAHRAERPSRRGLCAQTWLYGPGLTEVWRSPCVRRATSRLFLLRPFSSRAKSCDLGPDPRPQPPVSSHNRSSVVHVPSTCPMLMSRVCATGAAGSSPPAHGGTGPARQTRNADPRRLGPTAAELLEFSFSSRVRVNCRPLNKPF